MTNKTFALLFVPIALAVLAGCHSSAMPASPLLPSPESTNASTTFVEFHNRSSWNFAKEQRWKEVQQYMNEQASGVIELSQDGVIAYGQAAGLTSTAQLQDYLDGFERRRTGNPSAHSCRLITDLKKPYNYSRCSQRQLTAELFQQDEEQHGYQ